MGGWGHLAWDWCPMTSRKGTLGSLLLSTLGLTTLHNLIMEKVWSNLSKKKLRKKKYKSAEKKSLEDYWNKLVASAVQVSDCDRDLPVTHFLYSSFSSLFPPPSPPPLPFFLLHLFPSSFFTSTSSFPFFPLPPPLPPAARLPWPNMWLIGTKAVTKFGQKVWTKVLTNRIEVWPKGATWCEAKCKSCHLLTPDWWCVVPSHHADAGVLCQSKHDIGALPCDVPCLEANCLFSKGSTQKCSSEEDCKTAEKWLWHKSWSGQRSMERDWWRRLAVEVGVHAVCAYTVVMCVRARPMKSYDLITWWLDTYCADEHKILCIWAHWNYRQQHLTTPAQQSTDEEWLTLKLLESRFVCLLYPCIQVGFFCICVCQPSPDPWTRLTQSCQSWLWKKPETAQKLEPAPSHSWRQLVKDLIHKTGKSSKPR